MKRLLLLFTLHVIGAFTVAAQVTTPQTSSPSQETAISEGNWMIGAGLGSTNYNFSSETFNLNIFPKAAYFISDNVAVGAGVTLGLTSYDGGTNFLYGVAPLIRYYFPQGATATSRWFAEGNVGVSGNHVKDSSADQPVSLLLGVSAGYTHFITPSVALEATLGYNYTKADIEQGAGISGLGLGFGFQIYLPGKTIR
ncbi:hypothetical protein [Arcticibacter tournemirensis]|uniref:Porin family protein n=1 Tax=Arcticibacter tournemirensis TaxID=699437 RepID=A0A4Q0M8P7_9SPHI|nr:hypothetical protein [Arcticibacter tournemirensis]RXF69303.1 hypothetical protein EKH83_11480 [Arcticibacter tournemirensis]